MRNYYVSLTEKCNWNCEYCDFTYIKNKKTNPVNILKTVRLLNKFLEKEDMVHLEGGEIGLLSTKILDEVFDILNREVYISTNGLFMDKEYHKRYEDRIKKIYFHVVPDISKFNTIKYLNTSIPITYVVVVTRDSIDYLDYFLKNIDLEFDVLAPSIRLDDKHIFGIDEYKKLLHILETNNIKKETINKYEMIVHDKYKDIRRQLCSIDYNKILVDATNMKIQRCCMSFSRLNKIDLNEDNINMIILGKDVFGSDYDVCKHCNSIFIFDAALNIKNIHNYKQRVKNG